MKPNKYLSGSLWLKCFWCDSTLTQSAQRKTQSTAKENFAAFAENFAPFAFCIL
jgi:hypothetical protein